MDSFTDCARNPTSVAQIVKGGPNGEKAIRSQMVMSPPRRSGIPFAASRYALMETTRSPRGPS
jgi:hypothetical protein